MSLFSITSSASPEAELMETTRMPALQFPIILL